MSRYVCSDLHGVGELWEQIKEFLKPEDTLYYLGDATDRGPDGWKMLKEMLQDSRVIYVAGNHDVMLADRIGRPNDYFIAGLHHQNGGEPTWNDAENDPEANDIKRRIRNLPRYAIYTNKDNLKIFMSHSGSVHTGCEDDLLWDRTEFIGTTNYTDYDIIIHGHTPAPYLREELEEVGRFTNRDYKAPEWNGGAYWYCGWRCCVDCFSIQTRQTALMDLDTLEQHIFKA